MPEQEIFADAYTRDDQGRYVMDLRRAIALAHAAGKLPDAVSLDEATSRVIALLQEEVGGGPIEVRLVGPKFTQDAGGFGGMASGGGSGSGGPQVVIE